MAELSMSNITAGIECDIKCSNGNGIEVYGLTFLGLTAVEEALSITPMFDDLEELKVAYGVETLEEVEELGTSYANCVYALFKNDYREIRAYLYEGEWCIYSGAYPISISPAVALPTF